MHFQEFWDSCAQNKTSEILKTALSRILGLLCAEQNVRNFKKRTFRKSGTPVRRTKRRKSQKLHFQEVWDSCAQNKTSEISKKYFLETWDSCAQNKTSEIPTKWTFWDSCAQNKTSEISKNGLSGFLVLLCAEQNIGNLKSVDFPKLWDSCAQNKTSEISQK